MHRCYEKCGTCRFKNICSGCTMCNAPLICQNDCKSCPYMCIDRPGAALYFETIGSGINLLPSRKHEELPHYVPTLPSKLNVQYDAADIPFVAVHGSKFMSADGKRIAPRFTKHGLRKALGLATKTNAILHFYVHDRTIEGFWQQRKNIYPVLKEMGFNFVISPNFSVYEDSPRLEHLTNIRRSVIVYNELVENGIDAVPDISWYELKDLDRWEKEINLSGVKTISFSFQAVGGKKFSNAWKGYLTGLKYLCERITEDMCIIIVGIAALSRTREVLAITGKRKVVVINTFAFMRAKSGRDIYGQKHEDMKLDELFVCNVKVLEKEYRELYQ